MRLFKKAVLIAALFATVMSPVSCGCARTFVTVCDSWRDVLEHINTAGKTWKEIMVGSTQDTFNPGHTLYRDFGNLFTQTTSLIIIGQISRLGGMIDDYIVATKLESINLYGNDIKVFPDNFLQDIGRLRRVHLENNKIERLGQNLLPSFNGNKLDVVSVSRNKIAALHQHTFCADCQVEFLDLSHNRLTAIDPKAFPPTVNSLNLNHNRLEYLNRDVFNNVKGLVTLEMNHNRLSSVPNVTVLTELELLDLSCNSVRSIGPKDFVSLSQLQELNLSQNKIGFFELEYLPAAAWLYLQLDFNRLEYLALGGNDTLLPSDVTLYGNPWDCDSLTRMEGTMRKLKEKVNYRLYRSNKCDEELFAGGKLPICVGPHEKFGFFFNTDLADRGYAQFLAAVRENKKHVSCRSRPNLYKELCVLNENGENE